MSAHAPDHYYVPHGSHWPVVGSVGLLLLMVGVSNWLNGTEVGFWIMMLGVATIITMVVGWFGTVAPAGTPSDIVNRLNLEIKSALSVPEVRERALAAGAEPLANSPQEFAAFIRAETKKWSEVIKAAGVKLE